MTLTSVIPGCASWRRPGIHTPRRGYGSRAGALRSRPGMTMTIYHKAFLEPPRAHPDLLLGEENLLGVVDHVLCLPAGVRRLPAIHFHHPHLTHAAWAGDAEHLAGPVTRQFADHV